MILFNSIYYRFGLKIYFNIYPQDNFVIWSAKKKISKELYTLVELVNDYSYYYIIIINLCNNAVLENQT